MRVTSQHYHRLSTERGHVIRWMESIGFVMTDPERLELIRNEFLVRIDIHEAGHHPNNIHATVWITPHNSKEHKRNNEVIKFLHMDTSDWLISHILSILHNAGVG